MNLTYRESQRSTYAFEPRLIHDQLRVITNYKLQFGVQEDPAVFMSYLLKEMQDTYLKRFPHLLDSKATNPISQIFDIHMKTLTRCSTCSHESISYDHLPEIQLDIRNAKTLDDATDLFFEREPIHYYNCERCQCEVDATKQFSVKQAPLSIRIQLKRFAQDDTKINTH